MSAARPVLLFVNPWITDFTAYDFWLKPLGLLEIAAVVREAVEAEIRLVDCLDRTHPSLPKPGRFKPDGRGHFWKEEIPKPEILRDVPRKYSRYGIPPAAFVADLERMPTPDAVLVTGTMTYWYPGIQEAVEIVRRKWGRVPVILGGIYATLCGDHARRHSGADVVVAGPGENAVLRVLADILGPARVRPASYASIRDRPRPAFDLLQNHAWLPVLTSRGCPFRCAFCASSALFSGFERRDPLDAADEVEENFRRFATRNFTFYDDALLLDRSAHIVPFLEAVVRKELPVAFHTPNGLHLREIDDGLAALFRKAGVKSVYLSQESTDPAVLRESCPKVEPGDLERAADCLERAGYDRRELNVYLIAGLPNQSATSIREDILYVRRLGLRPHLAFFSPIPGTPLWNDLVRGGKLAAGADPLLHNKLAFPYLCGDIDPDAWEKLRDGSTNSRFSAPRE